MKKRTRNLIIGIGGLLLSAFLISGCTNSFCSDTDKSKIMFAIDPGVTTYIDADKKDAYIQAIDDRNAELEEGKRTTYVVKQVFDENPNLYKVIEQSPEGYYYQSKNVYLTVYNEDKTFSYVSALERGEASVLNEAIKTAISKTVSAGGYAPHIDYYETFDQINFEEAVSLAGAQKSDINSALATEILYNFGQYKFTFDDGGKIYDHYRLIHNKVVAKVGIEKSGNENYLSNYTSNMNTTTNNLRSCIQTWNTEGITYGKYGNYKTSVAIEQKSWGYAWSKGFFEGILVYPVAWMIDAFTNLFGGDQAVALPQLFALIVVTVIVRLFIFACTFPSTIQQQKMTALQPELAKIQAKYPNSNTSQSE